ncbi:glycosyltransferase family 2 protein [Georgenia yuyongxinii]|uniref:Glycosyltransferase family 2 protein n=1 Tax=Georgenia yuyongxinii TaxID=2589797 RepID=A0A5B8C6A9_9MICO|nr:glycosyltransferase [Georgenia yuyongxinii]QDC25650.1 glycosyltransferase family 2 protein [Georgenia yuyongxinii]
MADPAVDVVIAVHTPTRPIARAVASVLDGNGQGVRLSVVCHNIDADQIAAEVPPGHREQVRFLEHRDSVRSAAGPFNAGMRAADGEFVSIMGSDDTMEPGAVASWLALARRTGAETVVARLVRGARRTIVPTPPTRPRLRGLSDPLADRLSYRSAPLGLVSTAARARLGAELAEGLAVGDDVPYVTRLWFESKVAVDRGGPAYVIGEDAADRVTYAPRPIAVELAFVHHLFDQPWFAAYPLRARQAVAVKVARIHLFGAVFHRQDAAIWTAEERAALAAVTRRLAEAAPGYERVLSLADRRVLDAAADPAALAEELIAGARARRRHGRPSTVLTRDPRGLLAREGPARFMAASLLVR